MKTILDVMPPHETYIEPCMGSAEVFFRKPPADREIINDYNGDLVNLFRVLQDNQNLDKVIGRLYLSLNAELLFRQNKALLTNTPNILDDLKETAEDMRAASWDEINSAVAFFENQVYSFSSTGQAFGIMRRDLTHRFSRLLAACNRLRNATILHRDYKDAISYGACENCFILLDERLFDEAVASPDPEKLRLLDAYYTSGEWREDYEADENGELPPDLKRGVLSQDALYDLLESVKEDSITDNERFLDVAQQILERHRGAFEQLAKGSDKPLLFLTTTDDA
ncbi:MAG: DUF4298 domain-containing protein [Oscillospiraceae bacterium]|nr:DUF4298 domain-containing protein [Oscillospiraceae bacterium]